MLHDLPCFVPCTLAHATMISRAPSTAPPAHATMISRALSTAPPASATVISRAPSTAPPVSATVIFRTPSTAPPAPATVISRAPSSAPLQFHPPTLPFPHYSQRWLCDLSSIRGSRPSFAPPVVSSQPGVDHAARFFSLVHRSTATTQVYPSPSLSSAVASGGSESLYLCSDYHNEPSPFYARGPQIAHTHTHTSVPGPVQYHYRPLPPSTTHHEACPGGIASSATPSSNGSPPPEPHLQPVDQHRGDCFDTNSVIGVVPIIPATTSLTNLRLSFLQAPVPQSFGAGGTVRLIHACSKQVKLSMLSSSFV